MGFLLFFPGFQKELRDNSNEQEKAVNLFKIEQGADQVREGNLRKMRVEEGEQSTKVREEGKYTHFIPFSPLFNGEDNDSLREEQATEDKVKVMTLVRQITKEKNLFPYSDR